LHEAHECPKDESCQHNKNKSCAYKHIISFLRETSTCDVCRALGWSD
jgi:hypothetical protein